jgi:hypothetical protein
MLAPWLDRELAGGLAESLSSAHAARAEQLVAKRTRHRLARSLDRLIDGAGTPRHGFLTAVTQPCREHRGLLTRLAFAASVNRMSSGVVADRRVLNPTGGPPNPQPPEPAKDILGRYVAPSFAFGRPRLLVGVGSSATRSIVT